LKKGDAMEEVEKKKSKYGRPLGRPRGRKDSDLKRTILDLARQYRIPSLLWGALQEARKDMSKAEWFKSLVIVTELMIKCAPKEIAVSTSGNSQLIISGFGDKRQTLLAEGEIIESGALPHTPAFPDNPELPRIPARSEPGNAARVKELNAVFPIVVAPPIDDRRQKIIKSAQNRPEDAPMRRNIGLD